MMKGTILIAEADPQEAAKLEAALGRESVRLPVRAMAGPVRGAPPAEVAPGARVLSVFIASRVDGETLAALPDLELVTTRSTGYDHLDVMACAARGVSVATVPSYGENTVAEHTFALILALSRKVHRAWVRTQRGDFSIDGLQGFDLRDRTIGIVGTGHIGLHVAKIARGFGMEVVASDPRPQPMLSEDRRLLALERDESALRILLENQLLAGREDVVVTPHIGFDSVEAVQRIRDVTARNVAEFLQGRPHNLLPPPG